MSGDFIGIHTGSFSTPAAGNPTVVMVEAAYRHHGIDARYLNCEVSSAALGDAVTGARAMGWAGFNCSLPHKVAVIDHLDLLAESAELIGAVNTVVATDGDLVGHNTDGQGFITALRTVIDPSGLHVVVLGAGGAARAVAVETALAGAASVTVVNRNERRGAELARVVAGGTGADARFVPWEGPFAVPGGRRPRQRDVGRVRRRRRAPRRSTSRPSTAASSSPTSSCRPRGRRCCARPRPPGRRRSTGSGCSSARAPSPCTCGPVSSRTATSCGPRPPRRWASRLAEDARAPGCADRRPWRYRRGVRTSEQRRIRCT